VELSTFIIAVFCLVDDQLKEGVSVSADPRPSSPTPRSSPSRSSGSSWGSTPTRASTSFSAVTTASGFPPSASEVHRTTFARQAANLWKLKEELWQELLSLAPHDPTFAICDSMPLPARLFARAHRCSRFRGEASFGKDTLLRQTSYGFRAHVRIAWPG
jgi:hypothetical protein